MSFQLLIRTEISKAGLSQDAIKGDQGQVITPGVSSFARAVHTVIAIFDTQEEADTAAANISADRRNQPTNQSSYGHDFIGSSAIKLY